MFIPSHRLDTPSAYASHFVVEPFTSFDALFLRLREIGSDGCAGSMLWRHALETAGLARQAEAGDALISAALLHLVGPMVWLGGEPAGREILPSGLAHFGADLLAELYAPAVTEPIRLQASAQRFLARSKAPMLNPIQRTAVGVHGTSMIQPMTEPERECFATMPFARDAIRLSRWSHSATGAAGVERSAGALRRIAARSVCNDGFRWESSKHADDLRLVGVASCV